MRHLDRYVACALLATGGATVAWAQTRYTSQRVIGSTPFIARDLNDAGQVLGDGWAGAFAGDHYGFVWQNGSVVQTLSPPPGVPNFWVTHIDNNGVVYGTHRPDPVVRVQRAAFYRWTNGVPAQVPETFSGIRCGTWSVSPSGEHFAVYTQPFDDGTPGWVNENGWVEEQAFTWDALDPQVDLVFSGGGSARRVSDLWPGGQAKSIQAMRGINNSGVGAVAISLGGYVFEQAGIVDAQRGIIPIGTLGGKLSTPTAINSAGHIVGSSQVGSADGPVNRPFLWRAGVMTNLGILPGFVHAGASDINDAGIVVGTLSATTNQFAANGAFVWENGTTSLLADRMDDDPGIRLDRAVAINNVGQILVAQQSGSIISEEYALLTPVSSR